MILATLFLRVSESSMGGMEGSGLKGLPRGVLVVEDVFDKDLYGVCYQFGPDSEDHGQRPQG